MMKIQRVSVWAFSRKLDGKAWNPAFRWTERRAPLIVLELDNGVRGIGEAWSGYRNVDQVLKILAEVVAPALVGMRVGAPNEFGEALLGLGGSSATREYAAAWSGADIALWDAYGRATGRPVWELLGGVQSKAPIYASGGLYRDNYTLDDLRKEAQAYRVAGFNGMKMKVCGVSLAEDIKRVHAARQGLGRDAWLWLDAVNQLSVQSARTFWTAMEPFDVIAMQSPLPPTDLEGLCDLNLHSFPVIASEAEYCHETYRRLISQRAVTYLQYCIPLVGGFTGALKLDEWANSAHIRSTPQCFSTVVAQAATLHFAAARPNVLTAEFHCFHDHLKNLYQGDAGQILDGYAEAGGEGGLNVAIPELGKQLDGSVISCVVDVCR